MAEALKRPGGELASRPLHFFWVVDCSGSMYGEKIGTVNHAIQSTIPEMVDAAKDNPNAQLLVRTLKFSTGATWVTPDPVNIEDFAWDDLDAGGVTDLGKAFEMLAAQLTIPPMTDRALPPVIVLLSDGQPTDDYKKSLDISTEFAAEDNMGKFEELDGYGMLRYLTADRFGSVEYEIVAPCYEEAVSLHTDYTSPEYLAFEKKLYEKTLRKLGFGKLLPEERAPQKDMDKRKEKVEER